MTAEEQRLINEAFDAAVRLREGLSDGDLHVVRHAADIFAGMLGREATIRAPEVEPPMAQVLRLVR